MYLNFSIFFFLIILINNNILLLNEEILILLSFIIFCWLITIRLQDLINNYFSSQVNILRTNLIESLENFLKSSNFLVKSLNKFNLWKFNFKKIQTHFLIFNFSILKNLPKLTSNNLKLKILKKLYFSKHLEEQILKLISLIIINKLDKVIFLNKFFSQRIKIKSFQSLQRIFLYEYIKKLDRNLRI